MPCLFWQERRCNELLPESRRFMDRLIKLGRRNGLHLSADVQEVRSQSFKGLG